MIINSTEPGEIPSAVTANQHLYTLFLMQDIHWIMFIKLKH